MTISQLRHRRFGTQGGLLMRCGCGKCARCFRRLDHHAQPLQVRFGSLELATQACGTPLKLCLLTPQRLKVRATQIVLLACVDNTGIHHRHGTRCSSRRRAALQRNVHRAGAQPCVSVVDCHQAFTAAIELQHATVFVDTRPREQS